LQPLAERSRPQLLRVVRSAACLDKVLLCTVAAVYTMVVCRRRFRSASNPDISAMPEGPSENYVLCEEIHTGDRRCWEELCGELEQLSCPVLDRMRLSRPTHCEIFLPDDSAHSFLRPTPSGIQEHPCCECHCIATPRGSVTSVQSDSTGTPPPRFIIPPEWTDWGQCCWSRQQVESPDVVCKSSRTWRKSCHESVLGTEPDSPASRWLSQEHILDLGGMRPSCQVHQMGTPRGSQ